MASRLAFEHAKDGVAVALVEATGLKVVIPRIMGRPYYAGSNTEIFDRKPFSLCGMEQALVSAEKSQRQELARHERLVRHYN